MLWYKNKVVHFTYSSIPYSFTGMKKTSASDCKSTKVFCKVCSKPYSCRQSLSIHMKRHKSSIYLIQLREFLDKNEDTYKVGMLCQPGQKRFYPKGSKLLYQITCDDSMKVLKNIIHKFKESFVQMKDIGTGYFKGNHLEMFDIMHTVVKCEANGPLRPF